MSDQTISDKTPQPDPAEENAFFPSRYSLSQFTSPKSDLSGADYPNPYKGGKKVLMIGAGASDIYRGYKICAFPDALDAKTPDIGYMPGHLTWKFGEKLKALGFEIVNNDISGAVHQDRKLLTGDSPLAGNNLGKLAAGALLKEAVAG